MGKIAKIEPYTTENGDGVRLSIFISGCSIRCENCHNKELWDYNYGEDFGTKHIELIESKLMEDMISGVSILGGEPFDSPYLLLDILDVIYANMRHEQSVWVYTGYTIEDLLKDELNRSLLKYIDILVDGSYDENLKVLDEYRGSSNQRYIYPKDYL